jgi:hypothetical protein
VELFPAATAPPRGAITLVTQLTLSKLARFEAALPDWGGPVSVAAYAYTPRYKPDMDELAFFRTYKCGSAGQSCTLSVVSGGTHAQPYPINLLRNVALQAALTPLVLVFDTDFLPSPHLHASLPRYLPALLPAQHAYAIAAFDFRRNVSAPRSFKELRDGYFSRDVATFHGFHGGHQYTQPERYFESRKAYCLACSGPEYEPYLVVNKSDARFLEFDPAYVDRNRNKASWVHALKKAGYTLCVLPRVWLIHVYESRPHYLPAFRERRLLRERNIRRLFGMGRG